MLRYVREGSAQTHPVAEFPGPSSRGSPTIGDADRRLTPLLLPPPASEIRCFELLAQCRRSQLTGAGPAAPLRPDPLPRPTVSTPRFAEEPAAGETLQLGRQD